MRTKIINLLLGFACFSVPASTAEPHESVPKGKLCLHWITLLSEDGKTCILDDGSEWVAFVKDGNWQVNGCIWILPILQKDNGGDLAAIFLIDAWDTGSHKLFPLSAGTAYLKEGSRSLWIQSLSSGNVTLNDGSQWTLDPHYQKYYAAWQVRDPITVAGGRDEYYLINGTTAIGQNMSYSLASKISPKAQKAGKQP